MIKRKLALLGTAVAVALLMTVPAFAADTKDTDTAQNAQNTQSVQEEKTEEDTEEAPQGMDCSDCYSSGHWRRAVCESEQQQGASERSVSGGSCRGCGGDAFYKR